LFGRDECRPNARNAAILLFDVGLMNWEGTREKTVPLSDQNIGQDALAKCRPVVRHRKWDGKLKRLRRSSSILTPRKTKYAPPSTLIALKASADVARIAESPSAAAQV